MAAKWIPLESNPEVLTAWSEKAGVIVKLNKFYDIYGLDPELLAFVPQPVKAVIVLFPITPGFEDTRKKEDETYKSTDQPPAGSSVIWIKQTISNACGTIGLLHALMNSSVAMEPDCALSKFIDKCKATSSPEERAKILEDTNLFADMHSEAASSGQSAVPTNLDTDNHFTCFVRADGRLIELDGRRTGPIDRGPSEDLLVDVARIVKEKIITKSSSISFSMIALCANNDE